MIAILSTDPVLYRMLQLELMHCELTESPAELATIWLLDLSNTPRPLPKRHEELTVIGFTDTASQHNADIYFSLPYDTGELRRLLKHLAKHNTQAAPRLRHLPRLLIVDNKQISLSPAEDCILEILFAHRGQTVSEKTLLEALAQGTTANVLQVHIYRLRKKLAGQGHFLIRTVHGKGYCLHGEIED